MRYTISHMDKEYILVEHAKRDKDAFLQLYHIYYPKLYAYILVRTSNKDLTEDIVQDTFVKAMKALKSYKYRGTAFGAWLFTIAKNELVSTWRKDNKIHLAEPEEMEHYSQMTPSPHDALIAKEGAKEQAEQQNILDKAMEKLSSKDKELINLKYIAGLSYKDVSKILKKKPNALAVQLCRILRKLQQTINEG